MRLIDGDELIEKYSGGGFYTAAHVRVSIATTPTVIQTWRNVADGEFPEDYDSVLVYCEKTGGIIKSTYHEWVKDGERVLLQLWRADTEILDATTEAAED